MKRQTLRLSTVARSVAGRAIILVRQQAAAASHRAEQLLQHGQLATSGWRFPTIESDQLAVFEAVLVHRQNQFAILVEGDGCDVPAGGDGLLKGDGLFDLVDVEPDIWIEGRGR